MNKIDFNELIAQTVTIHKIECMVSDDGKA